MKKLISILLVAVLVLGMFPATALTAFAEDTVVATFELGANGSATHADGSSKTTYSETDGNYTLTFSGIKNMYTGARDAKGNGCIKLGASSKAGGFSFKAPDDVTSVVIYIAQYKANTTKITVNGTAYTLKGASNNGAYDAITVDTTSTKTVTLTTVSGGYRAMVNTIEFVAAGSASDCEHPNAENINVVAPGCDTVGTHDVYCPDCDEVIDERVETPANGHSYVDGICSVCGACQHLHTENINVVEPGCDTVGTHDVYCSDCDTVIKEDVETAPAGHSYVDGICSECGAEQPSEQTINFATADQRVSLATESQVWENGNVTFTNNKGTGNNVADYTGPARFYKGSELVIEAPSNITKIVFNCNTADYATALQSSIGDEATADGKVVTVELDGTSNTFTVAKLTAQVRMDSVTVTCKIGSTESACDHVGYDTYEGEDAVEGSCTVDAKSATVYCSNCGGVVAEPVVTPAPGHNYVDGNCTACGEADPMANLPGTYYIAAIRSSGNYWYMTSDLGTANTKRYQAVDSGLTELPAEIAEPDVKNIFEIVKNDDGTYSILAVGVEGNNYLGWTSDNSGILVAEKDALKLTVDITDKGYYNIHFTGDEERYLSLNEAKDSNYFAWYKGTQKQDLSLIPAVAPVVEMGGKEYASFEEAYAEDPDTLITLLAPIENIDVDGDLYLDLNGYTASVTNANGIFACDSSAIVTDEGTGVLTVENANEIKVDNTVDGKRYIALKGENNTYTFHVLELKLSAVSFRASQAGIYYKAEMVCDETLKKATYCHGMVVSVNNMPGADFGAMSEEDDNNCYTMIEGAPSEKNFTSCAVFGIFKVGKDNAARGEMKIYANAYIQLNEQNGEAVIMADTTTGDKALNDDGTKNEDFDGIAWSLREVMEALNATFNSLDVNNEEQAKQRQTILNFYNKWHTAMATWSVGNIAAAATAAQ